MTGAMINIYTGFIGGPKESMVDLAWQCRYRKSNKSLQTAS